MEIENEIYTSSYLDLIPYESIKEIKKQMNRGICKIILNERNRGTGFFCKIPFPDRTNMKEVLITNYHLIDEEYIKTSTSIKINIKGSEININLKDRIIFPNKEYDTTIIEIKESDNIKYFLKLHEKIINDIIKNKNENYDFIGKTIYITHYPSTELSMSIGKFNSIDVTDNHFFYHECKTNGGSSGSPTYTINNEVFGIHKGIKREGNNYFGLGIFLSYPIKKFINEMKLKQINKKYKLYIENTDVEKINLFNNGNIELKELGKIQFNKLKELTLQDINKNVVYSLIKFNAEKLEKLDLRDNKEFDMEITEKLNFKELKKLKLNMKLNNIIYYLEHINSVKLETLNLSLNTISNINILTKVNYPDLKELNLSANNITDIQVLENVKFEKLEILNLGKNKISDINILEKVNFKNLKELNLERNNISNINSLEKFNFQKLESLNLSYNNISDINILEKVDFKNLKELLLNDNNKISDINVLKNVEFKKLEILNLGVNDISNINILEKADFKELKLLILCANKISDINVLDKVNFPKLKMLSFGVNNITNIDVLERVNFKELEILGFSKNKISDINVLSKINFEKLYKLAFDENNIDKKKNAFVIMNLKRKVKYFYPLRADDANYYMHGFLD